MPYYILTAHNIENEDIYRKYSQASAEVMKSMPGLKFTKLSVQRTPTVYEGEQPGTQIALIEFESVGDYERFYYSKEYQNLVAVRLSAADTQFIIGMKAEGGS